MMQNSTVKGNDTRLQYVFVYNTALNVYGFTALLAIF